VTEAGADRGVQLPARLLGQGLKLFASPRGAPRSRRATDLVILVPAAAGIAAAIAVYPPSGFELALARFLASVPGWLDPVWGFATDLSWLFALALLVAALVRRRFVVVAQAFASLCVAGLLGLVAVRLAVGAWPDLPDTLLGTAAAPRFPSVRLAEAAAVIVTASPHLVRPWRRVGRWVLGFGVLGTAVAGAGTPLGTVTAVLIGVAAAAVVRLAGGTSGGRPGLDEVGVALAELGVPAGHLEIAAHQAAGVFHVLGADDAGRPLLVKVYGRDAYDTQLVATLWRNAWYRGRGVPLRLSRLEAAEHEAFVTLLARSAGLPTLEVVTAAATVDDDALLVLRGELTVLASLRPDQLDDRVLRGAWQALGCLNEAKIAHQQIDSTALALVGGEVGLTDFGAASVAPDASQLLTDRAQLLATLAAAAGTERALGSAVDAVGEDGVAGMLPYLQAAVFTPGLRRELKRAGIDVDALRGEAAARAGVELPEPIEFRRVTWWSAVQLALLALASYTIVDAASGVDWQEVRSAISDATWSWLVVAFVVAQLPRLTQTLTTLGSVPVSLPFGPVYAMQLAMGYMNVALPSNLARLAVNIRFFQRQGLSAPVAVASGAIDSFAGTVVQGVLLGTLLVFSESTLALELPFPDGGALTLLWILIGLLVASVLAVALVRRLREAILAQARRWWPDVRSALGALRASHKLALLVLGSIGTEALFALALGLFARGFGYDIALSELLVINISVSLLASFVPVPGGVGVAEFGLTLGLTSAGMTPETAVAAVLLYRISTFYLPPAWGFAAAQWLKRNRYL
jgi:glycosyltransferase 2 family protein